MLRAAYPLLTAAAIILIYWKITLSNQFSWMDGPDTVNQVLPWLQMQAREWRQGHFPLLDPFHWLGQPLIGQGQPGATFPLNWILFVLPLKHGYLQTPILNWYFVLIHILCGWSMYALARFAKLTRPVAALTGAVFGGGGFVGTVQWPQMLNGVMWWPLVTMFLLRYLQTPGRWLFAALAGAAGGCSILAGHYNMPILILTTAVGIVAAGLWERGVDRLRWLYSSAGLAVFGLFFFLAGAAQTLPGIEFWRVAYRYINAKEPVTFGQPIPYLVHRTYSLDASSLWAIVVEGYQNPPPMSPFLGASVLSLAVIGALAFREKLIVRTSVFLAVYSLLLAMGEGSFLHGLYFALFPTFEKARNPSALILGVHAPLILLAGFGIEALRTGRVPRDWGRWILGIGGAAGGVLLFLRAFDANKAATQQPLGLFTIYMVAIGCVLLSRIQVWRKAALCGAIILLEVGGQSTARYPDREMGFPRFDQLSKHRDIAAFLRGKRAETAFRVTVEDNLEPLNFGDWHGIEQANGYSGMSTNVMRDHWRPQMHALIGARYHVGKEPRIPGQVLAFEGAADGLKVWESAEYAPRMWTSHRFEIVPEHRISEYYLKGWPVLRDEAFAIQGTAKAEVCGGRDAVNITHLQHEYARADVTMQCDGLLTFSTAYIPGWSARVNGRPVETIESYGKLVGVSVPAGTNVVEFQYKPRSVYLGWALTVSSLMFCGGWWLMVRRNGNAKVLRAKG